MRFDVVIPVHDGADTISRAVRSVVAQNPSVRVVVVDDGSTDGSAQVAAEASDRVVVITQPCRGPGAARNRGVEASPADLVVVLDADDELLPGALNAFESAHRNGARLVRSGAIVSSEGKPNRVVMAQEARSPFPRGTPMAGTFSIDRELFRSVGVFVLGPTTGACLASHATT